MKKIIFIFTLLMATISIAQTTYVPDDNFEHYLETHDANGNLVSVGDPNSMGNGSDYDDYVTTANINAVTSLYIASLNIADLTGIEDFSSLILLSCNNNQLTGLDVSQNTALTELNCYQNQLTVLDLSHNTALTELNCSYNQLNTLDISQNTGLSKLYCASNQLTGLNLSHNTSLTRLGCQYNQLTGLDLSHNANLFDLNCSANHLTDLDLSNNTGLILLNCASNQLTALNVSQNTALTKIWCLNNQLAELNVQNGHNNNISNSNFSAMNNPDLTCIQVDNPAYSTTTWTQIDTTSSFSQNCHFNETYVPDDNFEAYLEANGMGNGISNDDYVTTANINTVTNLNVHNQNIADLTGIEDFTDLTILYCYQNQLTNIDITYNTALTSLWCSENQLTDLDISQNTALTQLYCGNNQLTSLDVSHNTALIKINCFINLLNTLDTSHNTTLTELYCGRNQLNNLDVSQNIALSRLSCLNNQLTDLDLSHNTALTMIDCRNNQLTGLNVKNGNNSNISGSNFKVTNNLNLSCIFVDDVAYSEANWTQIDANSHFVTTQTECDALSIGNEALKSGLKIYPNPISDRLYIQSENKKNLIIKLYNLIGQKLISSKTNTGYLMLNTSTLPAATYVVEITIGEESIFYNIVKSE